MRRYAVVTRPRHNSARRASCWCSPPNPCENRDERRDQSTCALQPERSFMRILSSGHTVGLEVFDGHKLEREGLPWEMGCIEGKEGNQRPTARDERPRCRVFSARKRLSGVVEGVVR